MTVPRLDAAGERRLHAVVTKLADAVDAGDNPTDALCKVAAESGLLPGEIRLLATTYNTGATLDRYANGRTPAEKAAAVALCDAAEAVSRLYPPQEKLAAAVTPLAPVTDPVDRAYALSPKVVIGGGYQAKRADSRSTTVITMADPRPADPRSDALVVKAAAEHVRRTKAAAASAAKTAADTAIDAVVGAFRRYDGPSLAEVRENWRRVKGAAADPIFATVERNYPPAAARRADRHLVDFAAGVYALVGDALAKTAALAVAVKAAEIAETVCNAKVADAYAAALPRVVPAVGSIAQVDAEHRRKAASIGGMGTLIAGAGLGEAAKTLAKPKTTADLVSSVAGKIGTPAHEEELSAIKTRAMLDSLMISDPIIGGYPREQVLGGYSRLSELAPRLLRKPAVAQTHLRKFLEGGGTLDPFDMAQLLDAEKKLAERDVKINELQGATL